MGKNYQEVSFNLNKSRVILYLDWYFFSGNFGLIAVNKKWSPDVRLHPSGGTIVICRKFLGNLVIKAWDTVSWTKVLLKGKCPLNTMNVVNKFHGLRLLSSLNAPMIDRHCCVFPKCKLKYGMLNLMSTMIRDKFRATCVCHSGGVMSFTPPRLCFASRWWLTALSISSEVSKGTAHCLSHKSHGVTN